MAASSPVAWFRLVIDAPYVCEAPRAVEGDSLRCGSTRLRLLGIDAPELGRCPPRRQCASGDGQAAKRSLASALRHGPLRYQVITHDRYGRAVVMAWAGGLNLSCWQLERRRAQYVADRKTRCTVV